MRHAPAAAVLVALAALPVRGQPSNTIRGRVIADDTDEPVANARVSAPLAGVGTPVVLTDDDGRFTLTIPAGATRLAASKTGYGRSDMPVTAGGQTVDIRLQRAAAVSGRVVDEVGEPIQGARVTAARNASPGSADAPAAGTFTDDRGEYRLAGLAAGRYVVATIAMGGSRVEPAGPNMVVARPSLQTLFYPGVSTRADAEIIALTPGDERPRTDFVIQGGRSFGQPFSLLLQAPIVRLPEPIASATASGIIRGGVVSTDGRTLPHADVRLFVEGDPRQSSAARADNDGQYEFRDLPPGRYRLMAGKTGFGPVAADDQAPNRRAVSIPDIGVTLADGERRERVDIRLLRWGTLSGRVLDERGDPLQGARVDLLRPRYEAGRRRLMPAASATALTDDLGRYRLSGLPPGQYIVSASVGDPQSMDLPGYTRTYYPGTTNPAQAQFVSIGLGQDQVGIDCTLARTRTARISGTIVNADGQRGIVGSLTLSPSFQSTSVTDTPVGARIYGDGQFEFTNVPPGQYLIRADRGRSNAWTEGEFGTLPVAINGADAAGVMLQTSTGSSIHGHVSFDARDPSARPRPGSLEIAPVPADVDLSPRNYASADIHADWTFDIRGVNGPRRFQLVRAPAEWALEDVRVNGVSVIDRPLPFGRREQSLQDVEIVLSDRVSELTGTVTADGDRSAPGASVVAFSIDRDRWYMASRFMRRAIVGERGAFSLKGLPFGSYYVVALDRVPDEGGEAWQDPDFLAGLIRRATTVTVREGQSQTLDLRIGGR
jgi:protocatechuate 3,4-dioxygenase beta subunit